MLNGNIKSKKVKGSVLYTVVAVMMIMTVLIFAAMTLASTANRRAQNSYANNQTQYTARSVIDSMMKVLEKKGDAAVGSLNVSELNKSLDRSMGQVTSAKIETLGTIKSLEDDGIQLNLNLSDEDKQKNSIYKLTATVNMFGQENTVSLYCYSGKETTPSIFNHSLTVLGDLDLDNSAQVYGSAYAGVESSADTKLSNGTNLNCEYGVRGNLDFSGNGKWKLPGKNTGIYVEGNMTFNGGGEVPFSYDFTDKMKYRELPYMYVLGMINFNGTDNQQKIGNENSPFLIMADGITQSTDTRPRAIYGDVYLYADSGSRSVLVGNGSCPSIASSPANRLYKIDNSIGSEYACGNLYSLGAVEVIGNNATIANNIMANELVLNGGANFTGAAVAKNLKFDMSWGFYERNFTFAKGMFYDPDYSDELNRFLVINGQKLTNEYTETTEQPPTTVDEEQTKNISNYGLTCDGYSTWNIYPDYGTVVKEDPVDITTPSGMAKVVTETTQEITSFEPQELTLEWTTGNEWNSTYDYYNPSATLNLTLIDSQSGASIVAFNQNVNLNDGKFTIPCDSSWASYDRWNLTIYAAPYLANWDGNARVNNPSASIKSRVVGEKKVVTKTTYTLTDEEAYEKFTKAINDVVFTNNGNVIVIDDIEKSVKLEKFIDPLDNHVKLRVSKALYTGINEGDEAGVSYSDIGIYDYETQYNDFLKAVVNSVTFPESMKKDNVRDDHGGFVKTDFLKEELLNSIKQNSKSYEDVKSYVEGKPLYQCSDGKVREYKSGKELDWNGVDFSSFEITDSCTLYGTFQVNGSEVLNIKPGDNEIYINLINFEAVNLNIVVDNSGKGKVIFIVPKNGTVFNYSYGEKTWVPKPGGDPWETEEAIVTKTDNVTSNGNVTFNKARLMTLTYYNKFFDSVSGENPVKIYSAPTDVKEVPNIYFYMDDQGTDPVFNITNSALITAYVNAPTATMRKGAGENIVGGKTVEYNDGSTEGMMNGIIGGAIFNKTDFSNPFHFLYIDEGAAASPSPDPGAVGNFTTLYYQCY